MTWTPRSADAAIKKSGVDVRDADGVTPLLAAVRAGDRAWVERLLAAGASLEGHEAQIESLGRRVAEGGRASLLHAAGSAAVAELLLARGLEVDGRDRAGCTPLHLAAHRADRPLVELLLDRGAALEAVDGGGHTALAHSLANLETLRLLLGRGASPAGGASSPGNPDEPGTWSPLTRAAGAGQVGVVEALLAAGARDPLALPVAAGAAAAGVVQRLLAVSVEPEPLRQALVAALAGDGKREARREVVLALLGREETPLAGALHAAATTGEAGYVELLLVRGAEANAVDGQGATALHHAARLGHHQAAEKLLAGGASPVLHDAAGHTPYELAERAYRGEPGIDDARLVMRALATAGGGPSRTREEVLAAGPQVGGQVEHPRFGRGTIVAIGPSDGKLTIDFPSGQRILLPRFVTLLS